MWESEKGANGDESAVPADVVSASPKRNGDRTAASSPTGSWRASRTLQLALGYVPANDLEAARIALRARIRGVEECVKSRGPKVEREIRELLRGASQLLEHDEECVTSDSRLERLHAAATQYRIAQTVYYGYVQKANRGLYLAGVAVSVIGLVLLPLLLYPVARGIAHLVDGPSRAVFASADLASMMILFGFAALGSLVSVFTRLDKIEIPEVFTWELIFAAGVGRPLVAAVFATIVYAVLKGHIVGVGTGEIGEPIAALAGPYWWCVLIAFLSGYSERFAQDLLGRSPFGDGAATAPARAVAADAHEDPVATPHASQHAAAR